MLATALMEKLCCRCREVQQLADFYRDSRMEDGRRSKCKTCFKQYAARRYQRKLKDPVWVERERERKRLNMRRWRVNNPEKARLRGKLWWERNPEKARAGNRAWSQRNKHKSAAHSKLNNAVARGDIVRPSDCSRCGVEPVPRNIQGHHPDYNKPLDVEWICRSCHGEEHRLEIPKTAIMAALLKMEGAA